MSGRWRVSVHKSALFLSYLSVGCSCSLVLVLIFRFSCEFREIIGQKLEQVNMLMFSVNGLFVYVAQRTQLRSPFLTSLPASARSFYLEKPSMSRHG